MYVARKVTRAKWEPPEDLDVGEIPADAISVDLRTTDNTLSFWQCGDASVDEIKEVVLALATSSQRIDRFELVWIAEDDLKVNSLNVVETQGQTPIASMAGKHRDIKHLDYIRLGKVAQLLAGAMAKKQYRLLLKNEVVDLITKAVESELVNVSALQEKVREEVQKALVCLKKEQLV